MYISLTEGNWMMNKQLIITILFICSALSACSSSQSALDVTMTQVAANIYANETSMAPTSTHTITPSPSATRTPTQTATPTSTPTLTPTITRPASILLMDDFSDPNSGWKAVSDSTVEMGYVDGTYRILVKVPDLYWTTQSRIYSEVSIDVDTSQTAGSNQNVFGIICRMFDNNNLYIFSITSDGYYSISKRIFGIWQSLGSAQWSFNDNVINTSYSLNHITATCQGDHLKLIVNGYTLMDVEDTDLTDGDIGLFAGAYEEAGVEILFDNFKASKP
jgi:hypothetical protein